MKAGYKNPLCHILLGGLVGFFLYACATPDGKPELVPLDIHASQQSLFAPHLDSKGSRSPASAYNRSISADLKNGPLTVYLLHSWFDTPEPLDTLKKMLLRDLTSDTDQKIRIVPLNYSIFKGAGHLKITSAIADQIRHDYLENNISSTAPYSFIAHSQGGLIALRYILLCLSQPRCEVRGPVPQKLKHVITMGSPFWGSGMSDATHTAAIKEIFKKFDTPLKQLRAISQGSAALNFSRKTILETDKPADPFRSGKIPSEIEFTVIAGDLSETKIEHINRGLSRVFAGKKTETDLMVDVYAARPDFIYYVESPDATKPAYSGEIKLSKNFYLSKLAHTAMPGIDGLSSFNEDQEIVTYRIIKKILKEYLGKQELEQIEEGQIRSEGSEQIESFASEIKVYTPQIYSRPLDMNESTVKISESSKNMLADVSLKNTAFWQFFGLAKKDASLKGADRHQTFFHTGRFLPRFAYTPMEEGSHPAATASLYYKIQVPGWLKKDFEVPVKPSLMTFSEIYLFPFHPYPLPAAEKLRLFDDGDHYLIATVPTDRGSKKLMVYFADVASSQVKQTLSDGAALRDLADDDAKSKVYFSDFGYCYLGVSGKKIGPHHNTLYSQFHDLGEGHKDLPEKSELIIYGRYATQSLDRYLVWDNSLNWVPQGRSTHRLRWMNVVDVDVVRRAPCVRLPNH